MLAIQNLTQIEKLRMMETLWDDLTHNKTDFSSPTWHDDVLKETETLVANRQTEFVDWETPKKTLRDK